MPTRVLLVDDSEVVLAGLAAILARDLDIEVVGSARTGEEGLRMLEQTTVDVAIVDYRLPDADGAAICASICASYPPVGTIVLTGFEDPRAARASRNAGAAAFCLKAIDSTELLLLVRSVAKGEHPLQADRAHNGARVESLELRLRPAELRLLRTLAIGLSNREIAIALGLSLQSVKAYLKDIYRKLEVRNRTEAIAIAHREGIV